MVKLVLLYWIGILISYIIFSYLASKNGNKPSMLGVLMGAIIFPVGWVIYFILRLGGRK